MDVSVIKNIADLARIELTQEEKDLYSKQLEDILGYFELLKEVDTDSVDLDKIGIEGNLVQMRPDDSNYLNQQFSRELLLSNLPEKENGFAKVKETLKKYD